MSKGSTEPNFDALPGECRDDLERLWNALNLRQEGVSNFVDEPSRLEYANHLGKKEQMRVVLTKLGAFNNDQRPVRAGTDTDPEYRACR